MSHYLKILFSALFVLSTLSLSANAAVENTTAVATTVCNATGNIISAGNEDCRATPSTFTTQIYEIGLCTAHPYGAAKTSATFDASTCVVIYTDAAPAAVNLAAAIGTNTSLPGTASAPAEGTYGFPYIKLGTDFSVAGSFTNTPAGGSATTYYSRGAGNAVNTTGPAVAQTDSLRNFDKNGNGSTCTSGYLGAAVVGGTMDGFITDASFARSQSTERAVVAGLCDKSTRLVAVMNLSAPFTVTSQTIAVNFNFVLTDYGVQFITSDADLSDVEEFGSAPFAGYFTVLNAD